jgi:hypothetical protein
MTFEQVINRGLELFAGRFWWELIDKPFPVVRDFQSVEKPANQIFLRTEQPDLQRLRCHIVRRFSAQSLPQPLMPLRLRFSLDEYRTQLTLGGDILDNGSVNPFLMLVKVDQNFVYDFGRTFAEDFITPHVTRAEEFTRIAIASSGKTDALIMMDATVLGLAARLKSHLCLARRRLLISP